jgi:hypothetical protein
MKVLQRRFPHSQVDYDVLLFSRRCHDDGETNHLLVGPGGVCTTGVTCEADVRCSVKQACMYPSLHHALDKSVV